MQNKWICDVEGDYINLQYIRFVGLEIQKNGHYMVKAYSTIKHADGDASGYLSYVLNSDFENKESAQNFLDNIMDEL